MRSIKHSYDKALQRVLRQLEDQDCPTCSGKGMWYNPGKSMGGGRTGGWVACESCNGTGERKMTSRQQKSTPRAGVHNNPKTGKTESISVGGTRQSPTLILEVVLHGEPRMESIEGVLSDLEDIGVVTRAEIHNAPPTLKLR